MKPVTSNRDVILSRVSHKLNFPWVVFKRSWIWLVETASHQHTRARQFVQHHLSFWGVVMTIDIDHVIVPTRNRTVSARMLADLLGVPWAGAGPFAAVYVNDALILDFIETEGSFAPRHYSFKVEEEQFTAVLERLRNAGIKYRSSRQGPDDMQINLHAGGRNIYWSEPDGHQWEILTISHPAPKNDTLNQQVRPDFLRKR